MKGPRRFPLHAALVALAFGAAPAFADYPIAGLTPDQRPAGAPMVTAMNKDPGWYERALHGVERPYPDSLKFLDNQGPWYTPFNHPGMPGRYDIRHWHNAGRP